MKYTQQATIKTHCRKLIRYVKMMDFILIDTKIKMIKNSLVFINN